LAQEHQEAERLLSEQRALIAELEKIRSSESLDTLAESHLVANGTAQFRSQNLDAPNPQSELPERLVTHYREMLRAYVVMGAGNLADEMVTLASLLTEADVSAQRAMQLHVHVLEELIGSLGNRSARHVMTRADLLVLEIMAHLADGYRRRYHEGNHPQRQLDLPGF
jgi:KaiA C-terminal domain